VLRDLIRIQIFGRFHVALGAAIGLAVAILAAWGVAFALGPRALAWKPALAIALAFAGAGGWALPRAVERSKRSPGARAGLRGAFALGFPLVVLAAGIAAFAAGFGSLALLLGSTGLSSDAGVALFRAGSAALVAGLALALAWGFGVEPLRHEVTRTRVTLPRADLRIAQLSDLHIGNGIEGARLDELVEAANALAADLVVLTGDLFDYDRSAVESGARALARLRAPLGVFAVLGNHDVYVGADRIAAALAALAPSVTLLRDAWRRLPTAAPLYLAGVEDPGRDWTGRGRELPALAALADSLPRDGPAILLVHRPDAFPQAVRLGFPLVLAGHYHGGQVAIGARVNAARLLSPFHRGLYRDGASQLYVSRGLGFAGPRIRLGSRREIALLEVGAGLSDPASRASWR